MESRVVEPGLGTRLRSREVGAWLLSRQGGIDELLRGCAKLLSGESSAPELGAEHWW